jgi:hypothetical protein
MYATNPNNGKTIRVLKSEASIWKNRKTLVYRTAPPTSKAEAALWIRWSTIVEGVDPSLMAWHPQIVILREDSPSVRAWLATRAANQVRFILISSEIVSKMGGAFEQLNLGNLICLEEMSTMYPFLGQPYTGTVEDAVLCAAIMFRFSRILGLKDRGRLNDLTIQTTITVDPSYKAPEPLVLIQQYYVPPQAKRSKELYKCLVKNLESPFVDKIILCMESLSSPLPPDPAGKITKVLMKNRISYKNCIEVIQKHVPAGHIVVFANTDIYLDPATWQSVWSVDLHDVFMALLRWEEPPDDASGQEPKMFGPRSDSQDTWVIHSDSVLSRTWNMPALDIPFGKSGCDNAILVEFLRQKFVVVNPAMTLRTMHVHQSEIRNYVKSELVDRPIYMHVDPTGIHELNPLVTWDWAGPLIEHEPLKRPLKATNPKALNMFCSQMNRNPDFVWTPSASNTYTVPPNQDHLIDMSGSLVGPSGLVYKHNQLCVGSTEIQKKIWSENTLSHLMPAQQAQTMMAFPLEPEWLKKPSLYVLYYLSRAIKQHHQTPEASMWCMRTENLLYAFKLFKWNEKRGNLIEYSQETQVFAEKVVGRSCHGLRVLPEDITVLRSSMFTAWKVRPDYPVLVIVADGVLAEISDKIEELAQDEGYSVRIVSSKANATQWAEALSGASRVIIQSQAESWAWLWMAAKDCMVLELQDERAPTDALLHLCSAAGLDWTLLSYPRATPDGLKKIVMTEIGKWFKPALESSASTTVVASPLPLIIVPPATMKFGFFGHKGDSFREMVDLWVEKGYVRKEEDPSATQCWLHGVGQTLLYDRPTWDWLEKSEQTYKLCLTGNPDYREKPNAKPWIFWPRQPRLVEKLAADLTPIEKRTDTLVFFGRIENDVQRKHRQNVDQWCKICSKFSMPLSAKEPYALSPEDYLVTLKGSRYGLCLRGFGPKCNREIELLAMGTVPIVADGVDYSNYADPLIEGLHVIYAKDAEDAKKKMAAIPDSQWETMSKAGHLWWKKNASVEGSWSKTVER